MLIGDSKRWGILMIGAALLVAGCNDSPTEPIPVATTIELNVGAVTLDELGETFALEATVYDQDEDEIPNATVTWTTSDDEVVTVTTQGVVEAIAEGTATITATSGTVSETVEVVVEVE